MIRIRTLIVGVLPLIAIGLWSVETYGRDRLPLQKTEFEFASPTGASTEFAGYDREGKPIYYDPKPRIIALGQGRYAFKWFNPDGRESTSVFERPDAIDLVVEAHTSLTPDRTIEYCYRVKNLPSSHLRLGSFVVQTFASGATGKPQSGVYIGKMTNLVNEFNEGNWLRFGMLGRNKKQVPPGEALEFVVASMDLPGLVECRAHGGTLETKGGGEMPPILAEQLPRHKVWPHGWTIGPDERLAKMSVEERLKYLVERLPQMLELGWIENQKVMGWYETNLKAGKAAEVRARAAADFKKNLVTSEVLALMTFLTR